MIELTEGPPWETTASGGGGTVWVVPRAVPPSPWPWFHRLCMWLLGWPRG